MSTARSGRKMTMKSENIPLLGFALLGFLHQKPSSGYDLRKIFATTPLSIFSDSPGAIYPALRRLGAGGFIRGQAQKMSTRRPRWVFRLTAKGRAELRKWLERPIARDDVVRRVHELFLRFGFMDSVIGEEGSVRFLHELKLQLAAYIPELRQYYKAHKTEMRLSGRLILEEGVKGYEAQLRWVDAALKAYNKTTKKQVRHVAS
jgi:DNA-binding PadR family transcriptional regulator